MFLGPIAVLSLLLGLTPALPALPRSDAAPTDAPADMAQSYRFAGTRWGASVDETRAVLAAHGFALALELRAGHYRHVRDILANGRDLVPRSEPAPEWVAPVHDNVRGAANYH